MSTYNGKDYLREQIDSILSQDCEEKADVKLKLLIRDDGSKDGTQEILRKYAAKYPDQVSWYQGVRIYRAGKILPWLCIRADGRSERGLCDKIKQGKWIWKI